MKSLYVGAIALAIALLPCAGAAQPGTAASAAAQQLGIVPEPLSVNVQPGTYALPDKVKIAAADGDARDAADFLVDFLKERHIKAKRVGSDSDAVIHLSIGANDPSIGPEGYRLAVTGTGITITANSGAGLFYGIQTLEQMLPATASAANVIQQAQITDKPQYSYRGVMLDTSRHYFPVSFIKQLIDVMAAYKLNTFHWHLVDDQAWRIEIKKYPKLTEVGSCGDHEHPLGTGPCQFYTQKEIRDVVRYAEKRHVQIVPEIEIPGHSSAALVAYPELACKPIPGRVYCPTEQTFTFLENVLDEVIKLFPSPYIHTGGDEVSPRAWNASAVAQDVMHKNNLADAHALQGWIDRRIEDYLKQHGRTMIAWDEALAGGVSQNAIIMSWRGTFGGVAAVVHGNNVVMAPSDYLYFNMNQVPNPYEPNSYGGLIPLEKAYDYDPEIQQLVPDQKGTVFGTEACLWAENVATPELAWWRYFPRTLAFSESAWSAPEQKRWKGFEQRTRNQYPRLEARGITFFIPGPFELKDTITNDAEVPVTLTSPIADATMYYTLDGSYPTTASKQYAGPFSIALNPGQEVRLRVVTILKDGRVSAPAEARYVRQLATEFNWSGNGNGH